MSVLILSFQVCSLNTFLNDKLRKHSGFIWQIMFSRSEIDLPFKKEGGLEESKYLVLVPCRNLHESKAQV